jgi:hypothetical protein
MVEKKSLQHSALMNMADKKIRCHPQPAYTVCPGGAMVHGSSPWFLTHIYYHFGVTKTREIVQGDRAFSPLFHKTIAIYDMSLLLLKIEYFFPI